MKQEKLESILVTAKKLFAKYGLQKTNLDEIARIARVAKGTIYNYFGSKDRVYLEVLNKEVDEIVEKVMSSVEKEASPEKKLVSFVLAKLKYMQRAVNILNLDREGIEMLLPSAEKIRNKLFEQENNIIVSILKEGMEKGIFKINDILLTAKAIGYALRGFELNWLVQESEELIEKYLDELLKVLFFGIMSKKDVKGTA